MNDLLKLPYALQIALGGGYLAYLVAYAGLRQHHTVNDAIFRTLAFGLPATFSLILLSQYPILGAFVGIASCTVLGALWRWKGGLWAQRLLRASNVSWTDDIPTAWLSITAIRTDVRPTQVAVDLTDGRTLLCENTRQFKDEPYGPCTYGLDGSVALYVTAERRTDGDWFDHQDVRHPTEGINITYIPASSIKRVELRLWTTANGSAEPAAALVTAGAVEAQAAS